MSARGTGVRREAKSSGGGQRERTQPIELMSAEAGDAVDHTLRPNAHSNCVTDTAAEPRRVRGRGRGRGRGRARGRGGAVGRGRGRGRGGFSSQAGRDSGAGRRVFVGNLSFSITYGSHLLSSTAVRCGHDCLVVVHWSLQRDVGVIVWLLCMAWPCPHRLCQMR